MAQSGTVRELVEAFTADLEALIREEIRRGFETVLGVDAQRGRAKTVRSASPAATPVNPKFANPGRKKGEKRTPEQLAALKAALLAFVQKNPGYMSATEAFREAFDDIAFHQIAMLAGVRGAYNAMLASLHPDKLEARFSKRLKRASFVSLFGRLRFWSMYRAQFEEIESDPEAHFQNLFGEEFARTCAEQLQALQSARRRVAQ